MHLWPGALMALTLWMENYLFLEVGVRIDFSMTCMFMSLIIKCGQSCKMINPSLVGWSAGQATQQLL
jgi:hypothetical protein